ncbi:MAG: P-loop NTPase [Myxococcota bacterium]
MRTLGLYLFASVKGGVGKSTLTVLAAKLLADRGRRPVILDADVLGPSLADGLQLCAPVVSEGAGGPDYFAAPTGQWHELTATRDLRSERKRWWSQRASPVQASVPGPPYLNDVLLFSGARSDQEYRIDAMLWRAVDDDGVRYLPSSSIRDDAIRIAPYLTGNHPHFAWARRLAWVLEALVARDPSVTDIVIDLPPGTWGIAHETLVLAGAMTGPLPQGYPQWHDELRWTVVPTIVTTDDRNDQLLAMEYWLDTRVNLPMLGILVNRTVESQVEILADIGKELLAPLRGLDIEDDVRFVPLLEDSLGRLFVTGELRVGASHREMADMLRLRDEGDLHG